MLTSRAEIDLLTTARFTIELAISEPDLRQMQLVIVGATGISVAMGSSTRQWEARRQSGRQLPSTRIREAKVTTVASQYLSRVASALLR